MKHNYEERKEARINYALEKAAKNKNQSESYFNKSQQIAEHIPLAQPILVGHHSENHHRGDVNKINSAMRNSVEADRKADYYADKARSIENNNAISSDDPEAVEKLVQKLKNLEKHQEFMKAANKYVRKKDRLGFLKLEGATEKLWNKLVTPDFVNRTGYPTYELTNNNANIRRIKERLETLKKLSNKTTNERIIKGIKVVENVEANRIQLIFPGKPSEQVRKRLKKEFRFIRCSSENAWQRFLNDSGIWAANQFLETYEEEVSMAQPNTAAA